MMAPGKGARGTLPVPRCEKRAVPRCCASHDCPCTKPQTGQRHITIRVSTPDPSGRAQQPSPALAARHPRNPARRLPRASAATAAAAASATGGARRGAARRRPMREVPQRCWRTPRGRRGRRWTPETKARTRATRERCPAPTKPRPARAGRCARPRPRPRDCRHCRRRAGCGRRATPASRRAAARLRLSVPMPAAARRRPAPSRPLAQQASAPAPPRAQRRQGGILAARRHRPQLARRPLRGTPNSRARATPKSQSAAGELRKNLDRAGVQQPRAALPSPCRPRVPPPATPAPAAPPRRRPSPPRVRPRTQETPARAPLVPQRPALGNSDPLPLPHLLQPPPRHRRAAPLAATAARRRPRARPAEPRSAHFRAQIAARSPLEFPAPATTSGWLRPCATATVAQGLAPRPRPRARRAGGAAAGAPRNRVA